MISVESGKAELPMPVFLEIVTLSKPEQLAKALLQMVLTESGIITLVRPEQPAKALSPIYVTESGIVILVRPEQQ
jgi:hypothetical protein